MIILSVFAFFAGVVTILSPCILPILPIILSGSVNGSHKKAFGIVGGFVISFTFFTLFLTTIVRLTGIPSHTLRTLSVIIILLFGISLLIPKFQLLLDQLFVKLNRFVPKNQSGEGFGAGILIGATIGLLWTPCVGPILASVISLALSGSVTAESILITFSYSLGTAIPMLAIILGGQKVLNTIPILSKNSAKIQKIFGVVMILTALAIYFNFDRKFQTFVLDTFPKYGTGLTKIEENQQVLDNINIIGGGGNRLNNLDTLQKSQVNAPEIIEGGEWFNLPQGTESLSIKELKGKVVLVDFWTYTCINCIRTLPYIQSWHEKYEKDGLVIIGVHTPEFEFEKSPDNLRKAISDFKLTYPIIQDNNYSTWKAYDNHYWPAKYLVDKDGYIRYTHFGEGEYDETEKIIQDLLKETGAEVSLKIDNPNYDIESRTPELYLGYGRMGYFATPNQIKEDKYSEYKYPDELAINHFAFQGEWNIESEKSIPKKGSKLALGYEAKNVFLVMKTQNGEGKVKVLIDGKEPTKDQTGKDVVDGEATIAENRLYELVSLEKSGKHTLELEFLDDNIEVYAFTFG